MIIHLALWRVRCANCHRWMRRARLCPDAAYCSYVCGAIAQPKNCASGWGFTSTQGGRA